MPEQNIFALVTLLINYKVLLYFWLYYSVFTWF